MAACEQQPTCMKRKIHTANTLVFGKQQRSFLIIPYSTAIQRTLMKVRSFGEALLEVEPPKSLEEWSMAMKSMQKRMKTAPGIITPDAIATSGSLATSGTFGCGNKGPRLASPTLMLPRRRLETWPCMITVLPGLWYLMPSSL